MFPSPKNLHFMITMEVNELLAVIRTKKSGEGKAGCTNFFNYQELRMSEVPLQLATQALI